MSNNTKAFVVLIFLMGYLVTAIVAAMFFIWFFIERDPFYGIACMLLTQLLSAVKIQRVSAK